MGEPVKLDPLAAASILNDIAADICNIARELRIYRREADRAQALETLSLRIAKIAQALDDSGGRGASVLGRATE